MDSLLAAAGDGRSGALVLRGEAGIGKSALLNHLLDGATGCRVVRAAGVQSEMELSYAGLHQLCAPLLTGVDALPEPQRDALRTAFGLRAGDPPDRFLVGLAMLSLLANAAGGRPLVCVVDDAQWLDRVSAQTLAFVARRLLAESIVLVLAVREPTVDEVLPGLPELRVTGLADGGTREEGLGWLPLACRMAHNTWDFESWSVLSARFVGLARETGALSVLPSALLLRLSNRAFAGDLAHADSLVAEAAAIGEATGSRFLPHYGALVVEPYKGRESTTRQAIEAITQDRALRGEGKVETATQWAAAVLHNGLGRYEEAYAAAERGCRNPQELGLSLQSTLELIEAAVRLGRPAQATEAVRSVSDMAQVSGTDWALGAAAGARALIGEGKVADALYREAIERLDATAVRMDLARVRLLYGEWLRRENRRVGARTQLGTAHDMLSGMGAAAFAERVRRELQATGATVRKRTVASHVALTPQEAHIARLARDGLTNPEIGAQLFISPHTVEWHLRKVFSKLGIASRKEIRAMPFEGATTPG